MKKYSLSLGGLLVFLLSITLPLNAQMHGTTTEKIDSLSKAYSELTVKMQSLEEIGTQLDGDVLVLKEAQTKAIQFELEEQCQKITRMADFVAVANTSINAMLLSNHLTAYLNTVSDLNNPTNEDLGFSLAGQMEDILERTIVKGKKKVAGRPKNKFGSFIQSLINNPITQALSGTLPVVNAITSVTNMVAGVAFADKDVSIEDVLNFNEEASLYIQHYEGLASAMQKFNIANLSIHERLDGAEIKLGDILISRINSLYPNKELGEGEVLEKGLASIIDEYYNLDRAERVIREILQDHKQEGVSHINMETALVDPRLAFPDFEIDRASLIFTEIDGLAKETLKVLQDYQDNIEEVLNKSRETKIGDPEKIDLRISLMREQLKEVEKAFRNAVHVQEVRNKFFRLTAVESISLISG